MTNYSKYPAQAVAASHRSSFRPPEERSIAPNLITERQLECLAWVQEGKSASDIGSILGLSGRTVEKHLIKICAHLGVKTRVQAVVRARELGLLGRVTP